MKHTRTHNTQYTPDISMVSIATILIIIWTPSIPCLLLAGHTRYSSCGSPSAASPAPTGLVWRLIGQYAGAPPIRPDQAGGPDLLQGELLCLPEACGGTGELVDFNV